MSNQLFSPPPYPSHSFLTVVRNAALELQNNVKAPDAMIGMALIGAMTMACQCHIEVKLPIGVARPVTQNILFIGESGERKSVVDRLVFGPFREADAIAVALHNATIDAYKVELDWWKTVNKAIRKEIDKSFSRGEATDEAKEKLTAHAKLEPKKPKLRVRMRSDITQRALMDALEGYRESIMIITDDGELLFKSGAMSNLGMLNCLWDSPRAMSLDRADQEHVTVMNPLVSMFIMTQVEVLNDYRENRGRLAKVSGHWARYLVGFPRTTKGTRWVAPHEPAWEYLPKFHDRIRELIAKQQEKLAAGNSECEVIEFSDDAKARWIQQANNTEWMIRPGEYMSDIDDFASKTMEIIARLAASMHYFAGDEGKISLDTLERAIAIVGWHVDEFKRLFAPQAAASQDQTHAYKVAVWLRSRLWGGVYSDTVVPKNDVLHNGPVRNRNQLNAALDFLVTQRGVEIVRSLDPKDKKTYVRLMNDFFVNVPV